MEVGGVAGVDEDRAGLWGWRGRAPPEGADGDKQVGAPTSWGVDNLGRRKDPLFIFHDFLFHSY